MSNLVETLNAQMSEVDLAHAILKSNGQPLYFKELIEQVLEVRPVKSGSLESVMSVIHTEINLDGRFVHIGQGHWALREWAYRKRGSAKRSKKHNDN